MLCQKERGLKKQRESIRSRVRVGVRLFFKRGIRN